MIRWRGKCQGGGVAHVCSVDILRLGDEESGLIWEMAEEVAIGGTIGGEEKEGEKKT